MHELETPLPFPLAEPLEKAEAPSPPAAPALDPGLVKASIVGRHGPVDTTRPPAAGAGFGGISLADLGLSYDDFLDGGRFHQPRRLAGADQPWDGADLTVAHAPDDRSPSHRISGTPQQGYQLDLRRGERADGKVFQNWQWPVANPAAMPILELVTNRVARSQLSLKYYLTDGVAGPAIDILAEFPFNRGFDLDVSYDSDLFPLWFPLDRVDVDSLLDAEGHSRVPTIVQEYVKAQCLQLAEDLNLTYNMIDLQKEAYVHGDGFLNRVEDVPDDTYTWDFTREHRENTIVELQGLNPTAIWLERNEVGEVVRAVGVKQAGLAAFPLDLDRLIHLKHKGSSYTTYGFPHTLRAMKELLVKEAYLNAAQAWGERYALPIRMLTFGVLVRAGDNSGPIATEAMRQAAEATIAQYDPATGHTIVAPFHWEYKFVGADGAAAMMVSNELNEANRRVLAALGVPSAFLLGDWTNYATARIQFSGLMQRLITEQTKQQRILNQRIFGRFIRIRGYVDNLGQPIAVKATWKSGHLKDDQGQQDFMAKMADLPGTLSLQTIRETMGFNHEAEEQRLDEQADRIERRMQRFRSFTEQPPAQDPTRMPPADPALPQPFPALPPATGLPQPPAPRDTIQQQVILRRIKEGLERVRDRIQEELGTGFAAVTAAQEDATLSTAQREAVARGVSRRVRGLQLIEAAYARRLQQLRAVAGLAGRRYAGTVVAFWLPAAVAERLSLPGGEPPEQLHLTLAYLEGAVDTVALATSLRGFAASLPPVDCRVEGAGLFEHADDDDAAALYAAVHGQALLDFRQRLVDFLTGSGYAVSAKHPDFTPHITLAYLPAGEPPPALEPESLLLRFASLTVSNVDGDRVTLPLGGAG